MNTLHNIALKQAFKYFEENYSAKHERKVKKLCKLMGQGYKLPKQDAYYE